MCFLSDPAQLNKGKGSFQVKYPALGKVRAGTEAETMKETLLSQLSYTVGWTLPISSTDDPVLTVKLSRPVTLCHGGLFPLIFDFILFNIFKQWDRSLGTREKRGSSPISGCASQYV